MKVKAILPIFLIFSAFFIPQKIQAQTPVYLSVAASMTDAFNEMIVGFEKSHPDIRCLPNFGGSGSLAKQIEQGAPSDIFVSANPKWMEYLVEKGSVAKSNQRIFAYNELVFVGAEQKKELSLNTIASLQRIALGTPSSVPAGQYAKEALEKAGVYKNLEKEQKLVFAKDVRQALIYADRGEVSGAFVYKTDALLGKNIAILFTVPQNLYTRVAYPVGLTDTGVKNRAAREFYEYMKSDEALAILTKFGFETVQ